MFVTRAAYDAAVREADRWASLYEALLEKYHALKVSGAATRSVEAPQVIPASATEGERLRSLEREMAVEQMTADLRRQGLSVAEAHAEAQRAIDSLYAPLEMS